MSEARAARLTPLQLLRWRGLWPVLVAAIAANVALIAIPALEVRMGALWLLAGALPAVLSERLVLGAEADRLTRGIVAVGLAFAWMILGALLLQYLPGPLSRLPILSAYNLSLAGLSLAVLSRRAPTRVARREAWPRAEVLAFVVLLLLAALPRLIALGYSEFQGDEVAVLSKAAAIVQGREDAIFFHKKGPAEILLPALLYAVSQRMTEGAARLPSALAGVVALATLYAIARNRRVPWAAAWAVALAVANGFFVAFGRIVQYQSLVLLFSALALLCALRYSEHHRRGDVWLCALFLAVGLLAHSDTAMALPACAWIILADYRARRAPTREVVRELIGPVALAAVILGLFYVPFVLHGHFGATRDYLSGRLGTPPVNNLGHIAAIGSAYNAFYLLAFIGAGLVVAGLAHLGGRLRHPGARWTVVTASVAWLAFALVAPERLHLAGRDLSALAMLPPLVGLFLARGRGPAWRGAALWFAVPFVFYGFVVEDPRTHVYALFPGACLLLGTELATLRLRYARRALPVLGLATLVLLVSMAYVVVAFVSHTPEYRRTYPRHRLSFFWVPFGDAFPQEGLFGFPYRVGWKVIGALYDEGVLRGDLRSNEEDQIVGWYTRGQPYCSANPRYVVLAENVQDERPVSQETIERDYTLVGRVRAGGKATLRIYERRPAELTYREYDLESYASRFDRQVSGPYYPTGLPATEQAAASAGAQRPEASRLGPDIELVGYTLNTRTLAPSEPLAVTFYWRTRTPLTESYTAFVHLEDPGVVWAQKDTPPACGAEPTDRWEAGAIHEDTYVLVPSRDTPAGEHALVAGMYLSTTGERLPVLDAGGNQVSTVLDLGTITYVTAPGG